MRCAAPTRELFRFLVAVCIAVAIPSLLFGQTSPVLTGTATDAASGNALKGVRIGISGSSRAAVTDDDGRYRLEGLSAGDYTITASHLGSEPATQTVRVPASGTVTANF